MSYYADPDHYYYGTTAREAFAELDRLGSRIARDRRKASLSAAPPAAVPSDRPADTSGGCNADLQTAGPAGSVAGKAA